MASAASRLLALPASRTGTLGSAASASFLLNVLNLGATVLVTALLARAMDIAAFGIYSWVVAVVTLLTVPAVLGADRLLVRDVAVYMSRSAYGHVLGLVRWASVVTIVVSCVVLAAGAAVALVAGGALSVQWTALVIGLVALPFVAGARIVSSALMGAGHVAVGQAVELALRPVLLLGIVGFVLISFTGVLDARLAMSLFVASAAGAALVGVIALRRRVMSKVGSADAAYKPSEWIAAAVALTLLSGAALINTQTGVALLGVLDTPDAAGLYAVAQRGALLVAFPLMAVNAALAPTAARLWAAREIDELQRLVTKAARASLLVAIAIALFFVVGGRPVLGLTFGTPFEAATGALIILTLGQTFNVATGSVATLLVMSGHQWRASLGILAGAAINVVTAAVLIPTLHAEGAALAATASLVVTNVVHVAICRRTLGIDPSPLGLKAAHPAARGAAR